MFLELNELFIFYFILIFFYLCYLLIKLIIRKIARAYNFVIGDNNEETSQTHLSPPQQYWSRATSIQKNVGRQLDLSPLRDAYSMDTFRHWPEPVIELESIRPRNHNFSEGFPYSPNLFDVEFQEVIERRETQREINLISMINLNERSSIDQISLNIKEEDELYFHGTDAWSAKCILDKGIDLKKSKGKHDFSCGYGFYVTTTFKKAMEWAHRKSKKTNNLAAAVIAFRVLERNVSHRSLGVTTNADKKHWEAVVSHFRNGQNNYWITTQLASVKFIEGPVSVNSYLRPGESPTPNNFNQICLIDDDYANRFGRLSNISNVIFFTNYK